jgi:two-component system cell cycle sensor histidine kinase/response regulator CckA
MSEKLRVLQVEDNENDAALIIHHLENAGYAVQSERIESADEMRRCLALQDWDVVIADYQMPQFDAVKALRIRNECARDVPFIVVSGTIKEDRAVEMMRAGAQDYVLKDQLARLASAVRRETEEARARGDRRREHRRVEDQLRDRDDWLALAIHATKLGMFDFYPQSRRLLLSETCHAHAGLPKDSHVSYKTVLRGIHPADRGSVVSLIRKSFNPETGGEYLADYRTIGIVDKVERWLTAQGKTFWDGDGKPARFVGVTMDITQRKQLEEQLLQTQKLEGIGMLAGGVAHDFNNLLTIISGYSEMTLQDLPLDNPCRGNVEQVLIAADRAAVLTRQLLTFSRRQASQTKVVLLNDLVTNVQKMFERLIGEDLSLTVHLDREAGSIRADPGHIDQVIMNLVVNARDAMPNGGTLVIETGSLVADQISHPELAPGRYASLAVSDNGSGMSAEVRSRIFDPFFTTKQVGKGTGLGLSTVYGIVKQCGGSITVTSELGRGSKFTVFLPVVDGEHDGSAAHRATVPAAGTETILVAEDEPAVRGFVRVTLEQNGYRVLECANGVAAVEQARHYPAPIHLLLSDVVMPEMSSSELAAQFALYRPGVPVLCMSGYSDPIWPQTADGLTCLQKPFSRSALLQRVRAVLEKPVATDA